MKKPAQFENDPACLDVLVDDPEHLAEVRDAHVRLATGVGVGLHPAPDGVAVGGARVVGRQHHLVGRELQVSNGVHAAQVLEYASTLISAKECSINYM